MAGRAAVRVLLAAVAVVLIGVAEVEGPATADEGPAPQRLVGRLVVSGAPGAVAVVRAPGGTVRAAAGFARLRPRARMHPSDRFRVASITKTFVATVVLQLAAESRLHLDDPVDRWLPGLIPSGRTITLRQLLGHTSGLFDYTEDAAWVRKRIANPRREWSPRELVAISKAHAPLFAAGTKWSYSNTNYVVLGLVVEAVTGTTLRRELERRIFSRLRLGATSYPSGTALPGPFAHGYIGSGSHVPLPAGTTLLDVSTRVSPSAWGAGQIVSNADDLTRFFGALLGGRLLPAGQLAAMKADVRDSEHGLGLEIAHTACGTAYGHTGDMPGYRTTVWATANGRRAAAVLVNLDTTHVPWAVLDSTARTALCGD
jgi:D-alanyl-D-alanine carboxypeptidase